MDEKEFDYMNVIPFVDIMLVLLTIVLMTSTFVAKGVIPVDLPGVSMNEPGALKNLTIELDRQGKLFLDAAPVTLQELRDAMGTISRSAAILIRADKSVRLQEFVAVLDLVKNLGFHKVHLQTEVNRP